MKLKYLFIATIFSTLSFAQTQKDSLKEIEHVNILVKKKLLERKADRLIFNVDASIASQGMDAGETLANVPMLKVDENLGTISIIRNCIIKLSKIHPLRKHLENRSHHNAASEIRSAGKQRTHQYYFKEKSKSWFQWKHQHRFDTANLFQRKHEWNFELSNRKIKFKFKDKLHRRCKTCG